LCRSFISWVIIGMGYFIIVFTKILFYLNLFQFRIFLDHRRSQLRFPPPCLGNIRSSPFHQTEMNLKYNKRLVIVSSRRNEFDFFINDNVQKLIDFIIIVHLLLIVIFTLYPIIMKYSCKWNVLSSLLCHAFLSIAKYNKFLIVLGDFYFLYIENGLVSQF
jgi:hypothetical protein